MVRSVACRLPLSLLMLWHVVFSSLQDILNAVHNQSPQPSLPASCILWGFEWYQVAKHSRSCRN